MAPRNRRHQPLRSELALLVSEQQPLVSKVLQLGLVLALQPQQLPKRLVSALRQLRPVNQPGLVSVLPQHQVNLRRGLVLEQPLQRQLIVLDSVSVLQPRQLKLQQGSFRPGLVSAQHQPQPLKRPLVGLVLVHQQQQLLK